MDDKIEIEDGKITATSYEKAEPFGRTGIFLTEEEHKEILELSKKASLTPMMLIGGKCASVSAWRRVHLKLGYFAKEYGLPFSEEYGYDGAKKELLK